MFGFHHLPFSKSAGKNVLFSCELEACPPHFSPFSKCAGIVSTLSCCHLCYRFFKIQPSSVHYCVDQFDALIKPKYITEFSNIQKKQQESKHISTATGEEESLAVVYAFEELCKQIRNIDGLPLDINSIQGSHPAFRLTEVLIRPRLNVALLIFRT